MIIIKPRYHHIACLSIENSVSEINEFDPESPWPEDLIQQMNRTSLFVYDLPNGANYFSEPLVLLNKNNLHLLEACASFSKANALLCQAAKRNLYQYPEARHVLLIETAFFSSLPLTARAYALPISFFKEGIQRFGSEGILHQAAWNTISSRTDGQSLRVVSILLGDQPHIAAIDNGKPVETSSGFSNLEGIPGLKTCGDIDPEFAISLASSGYNPTEIEQIFSEQSGYAPLSFSKSAHLIDLIKNEEHTSPIIRDLLSHAIRKAIGMAAASMGGLDCLIWSAEGIESWHSFIVDICSNLTFMGLKDFNRIALSNELSQLGGHESNRRIFEWNFNYADVLQGLIQTMENARLI